MSRSIPARYPSRTSQAGVPMRPITRRFGLLVLAVVAGCLASACGNSTGPERRPQYSLSATVTDDAGVPIAGATVAILDPEASYHPCPGGGPGDCSDRAGGSAYTDAAGR